MSYLAIILYIVKMKMKNLSRSVDKNESQISFKFIRFAKKLSLRKIETSLPNE